jgi:hypothetical protein
LWTVRHGNPSTAECAVRVFESTGQQPEQLVYGYYLTRGGEPIIGMTRFPDGPYAIRNRGDSIEVTPSLQMRRSE